MVISLKLKARSCIRSALFIVVPSKDNYNLLFVHEQIQVVETILLIVHQVLVIWYEDGYVKHAKVGE